MASEAAPAIPPGTRDRLEGSGLAATLGITFVELTRERVVARMPVGPRVHQPFGLLHGGASVALAESVASVGAWLNLDREREGAVGLEINANHVRGLRDGVVTATATPAHLGRTTHVWDVRIVDEADRLVCVSRCTVAIIPLARPDAPAPGADGAG
ncbi:esterase [Gemmatimonadetes bacterium T265]|nr:esterase [Gemmatimonadetes bacterium T265]